MSQEAVSKVMDALSITPAHSVVTPNVVMVHPLVLLSVVDHYYRAAKACCWVHGRLITLF
jgi:hypothetical protein